MEMNRIPKDVILGKNVTIREGTVLGKNVILEDDVFLDYGCIIRDNVHIKKGSFIGAKSILGEYLMDFYAKRENGIHPLIIGEHSIIRTENVIYGDVQIGDYFQSGHKATVREKTVMGNNCSLGTYGDVQGNCEIGNYCRFHSSVFICPYTKIADYVWIFSFTNFSNDPHPPCARCVEGPSIDEYAVIAGHCMIMPGVHIGKNSLVGAMSLVNKDVEEEAVVRGIPAKKVGTIYDIKCTKGIMDCPYPWKDKYKREP